MGYNFLYGLWKYSWDADCELFLKILQEETKEDVYTQQIQLQASGHHLCTAMPVGLLMPSRMKRQLKLARIHLPSPAHAGMPLQMTSCL